MEKNYVVFSLILLLMATITPAEALNNNINMFYSENVNPFTVNETFDGTTLLELLNKAILLSANGEYTNALKIVDILSKAYVPQDLAYSQNTSSFYLRELILTMNNLSSLINRIDRFLKGGKCYLTLKYENKLRTYIINAFSIKYKLIDEGTLRTYKTGLLKYIRSPNIRFTLSRNFAKNMDLLIRHLDSLRSTVIGLIDEINKCNITSTLIIKVINYTKEVLGGHSIKVYGKVMDINGNPIVNATISLSLVIAGYSVTSNTVTNGTGYFNGTLHAPPSSTILKIFPTIPKPYVINSSLYIYAHKEKDNSVFNGLEILNISIEYIKPLLEADCPASLNYTNPLKVNLTVKSLTPLKVSVYLDNTLISNYSLTIGLNRLVITINNTTTGLHTLKLASIAHGPYLPTAYFCTLAITKLIPSIKVSINSIVLYPFDKLRIYASIINVKNKAINVSIIIDNKIVYTTNKPVINVTLHPPITYLIQYHTINLVVKGKDISESHFNYVILGINPLGITASLIIVLIGFSIGLDKYLLQLPYVFIHTGRILLRRTTPRSSKKIITKGIRRLEKTLTSRISSTIVRIYWLAVKIISKIVGEQMPSETLREYLAKSKKFLRAEIYQLFEKITLLAERDLYSQKKTTKSEEEEAKRILEMLRQ